MCGRCGRRLLAAYSGTSNRLRYTCMQATMSYGAPGCLSLAGTVLDDLVAEQVMQVLAPASLELSIAAEQALRAEREQLERHWQQRLERSRYEVERAARQYAAVEPENRLVARSLEKQWEERLRAVESVEKEYHAWKSSHLGTFTQADREAIEKLGLYPPRVILLNKNYDDNFERELLKEFKDADPPKNEASRIRAGEPIGCSTERQPDAGH